MGGWWDWVAGGGGRWCGIAGRHCVGSGHGGLGGMEAKEVESTAEREEGRGIMVEVAGSCGCLKDQGGRD